MAKPVTRTAARHAARHALHPWRNTRNIGARHWTVARACGDSPILSPGRPERSEGGSAGGESPEARSLVARTSGFFECCAFEEWRGAGL